MYTSSLVKPGNINLARRPVVRNPDESVSTVRTITVGTDQGYVNIPTVINGKVVPDQQAIRHYRRTGQHLGIYTNEADAIARARGIHRVEAKRKAVLQALKR